MELFKAENIVKTYGKYKALDNVSINVEQGSVFGLLGPNGAGKTSLIRIINQITAPDSGHLFFEGAPLRSCHIKEIGYLPEERGLYKKMKVGEQALYLAQLKGMSRNDAMNKLKHWFEKFEIQAWWDRPVEELSKGMQQKVQFITTVLHSPKLLIFDEPFSGFDPINSNLIKEEILQLKKEGATLIFSTHNMSSVEELCDNIALIDQSQVILSGAIKEIRKKHRTNRYEIEYEQVSQDLTSILNDKASIIKLHQESDICTSEIITTSEVSANELLQMLIPHIKIHSFKEIIPSMNDIFIRTVERHKLQN